MNVGVIGGIGSGKSTLVRHFADKGALVISGDKTAHEVLELPDIRSQMIARWGEAVVSEGRKAVSKIVFSNREELSFLEAITLDPVRDRIIDTIEKATANVVVLDVPMLIELALTHRCDHIVFVDAPYEHRLKRFADRMGWFESMDAAKADFDARESRQASLLHKRTIADHVIHNHGTKEELELQARELWDFLIGVALLRL